ncbi:Kinase, NEK [Giardia muris]|uniref:Kinase, NEK n=1 Tax=Giardia muris TaxID=5742 RepID=A0A4Z1SYX9_GIAMU|nr:Kinase, NEK [Giardia muris]|eukprot:TNJ29965.1 Kinase, NEK [Giardia muris]
MLSSDLAASYTVETQGLDTGITSNLGLLSKGKHCTGLLIHTQTIPPSILETIEARARIWQGKDAKGLLEVTDILWSADRTQLLIVQDTRDYVSLAAYCDGRPNPDAPIDESMIWDIAAGVIEALGYLRLSRDELQLHLALSMDTIFISLDADVGSGTGTRRLPVRLALGCLDPVLHPVMHESVDAQRYTAPELFTSFQQLDTADLFSLGVVLYELAMCHKAFLALTSSTLQDTMKGRAYKPITGYTTALTEFISDLMEPDSYKRIGLTDAFLHPTVSNLVTFNCAPLEDVVLSHQFVSGVTSPKPFSLTGGEPDAEPFSKSIRRPSEYEPPANTHDIGATKLIIEARKGDIVGVRQNLNQAKSFSRMGMTALMYAARKGHAEVVEELIPYEAGLRCLDEAFEGYTALMFAALHNQVECVKLLIGPEAGLANQSGRTAFMIAAIYGHFPVMELLVHEEARKQDNYGWSALMCATIIDSDSVVEYLVPRENNIFTRCNENALSIARRLHPESDIVRKLEMYEQAV